MKKTVIKRRKRVPAVGGSGRSGSANPGDQDSPSMGPIPMPGTPQAATIVPAPPSEERPVPKAPSAPPASEIKAPIPAEAAPNTQTSTMFDVLGIGRPPQSVPLIIPAGLKGQTSTERKRPWWIDSRDRDKEEQDREAREREGVSRYLSFQYPTLCP